jgi:hypothetical protein
MEYILARKNLREAGLGPLGSLREESQERKAHTTGIELGDWECVLSSLGPQFPISTDRGLD